MEDNVFGRKIVFLVVLVLGLFIIYEVLNVSKDVFNLNYYDAVIVGNNCECQMYGKCKHTYGIKGGEISSINMVNKVDTSNRYRIIIGKNDISYFDNDTWFKYYEENGHAESSNTVENDDYIKKYKKYMNYKSKDYEVFKKIYSILGKQEMSRVRYFIIEKGRYFILKYDKTTYKHYIYEYKNNGLEVYMEINDCDIDYFHINK